MGGFSTFGSYTIPPPPPLRHHHHHHHRHHDNLPGQDLDAYISSVVASSRRGVDLADKNVPNWSFGQSFLFSATVIIFIILIRMMLTMMMMMMMVMKAPWKTLK